MKASPESSFQMVVEPRDGGLFRLVLLGRLNVQNYEAALGEFERVLAGNNAKRLELDLARLEYLDSAGGLCLSAMQDKARSAGAVFAMVNQTEEVSQILKLVGSVGLDQPPLIPEGQKHNFFEQVGLGIMDLLQDFKELVTFFGRIYDRLYPLPAEPTPGPVGRHRLLHGAGGRGRASHRGAHQPFAGAHHRLHVLAPAFQLRGQYLRGLAGGARHGKGTRPHHDRGPGGGARSGSAFAAEIGTMKVNEEVDALAVMGFDPTNFLAVPKVVAAMFIAASAHGVFRGVRHSRRPDSGGHRALTSRSTPI